MKGIPKGAPHHDLVGRVFADLSVISHIPSQAGKAGRWLCRCICGQERLNSTYMLNSGRAKSCGCTKHKRIGEKKITHGHTTGSSNSRTYRIWTNMKTRCLNPKASNFAWYGGRGIGIDPEWAVSFEAFFRDMGEAPPGMTLDRKDGNGNYGRLNCRWASMLEQNNNRRGNRVLTIFGERVNMTEAARRSGIRVGTLWSRLDAGWSDEEAVGLTSRGRLRGAWAAENMPQEVAA